MLWIIAAWAWAAGAFFVSVWCVPWRQRVFLVSWLPLGDAPDSVGVNRIVTAWLVLVAVAIAWPALLWLWVRKKGRGEITASDGAAADYAGEDGIA